MQETERRVSGRDRMAGTVPARVVRTGERPPRPEWEGLFREPNWPPHEEDESG